MGLAFSPLNVSMMASCFSDKCWGVFLVQRIKALKKWAPMIKELTQLASDNHKQLTVLRGIGINQEIDKLSQLVM